jgi:ATP-binding cassette subfamily B multidrug efflux pump
MSTRQDQPVHFGMPVERSRDLRRTVRGLRRQLRTDPRALGLVGCLTLLTAAMSVLGPVLLGRATDVVVRGIAHGSLDHHRLRLLLLEALGVYGVAAVSAYTAQHVITGVVQRAVQQLRADVEDKLHRLPLGWVDRQPRGDLLSRVTNDVDNVAQSLQQTLGQLLSSLLTMMGTVVVMVVISPLLFLVVLVTVPLTVVGLRLIAARSQGLFARQWSRTGSLNAQVEEACSGHAIITAFGRQHDVEERFRATNDEVHDASLGAQVLAGMMQPVTVLTGNLTLVALAVIGGLRIAAGGLSVGTVQVFLQYSRQLTMPMTHVASMASVLQSGLASAERVLALLAAPEDSPDAPPTGRRHVAGEVAFEDVSFSYTSERPLLEAVSFVAEAGHTVAIVGPTGAGKTTLVNLLLRFYEIDGGRITIDGTDIRSLTRAELRSAIGMVLQDTWLFQGTIRDNILYGDPSADEERFLAAAKAAFVDRFVHALPNGYDTVVDDAGTSLSAGEKQLVTIARAFLADRAILVLDEATSSVDTRTEVLVQHAMAALRRDRTCFVIAHRLSTIRDAETILVMDDGRIVEKGDHASLVATGGAYAALYASQFEAAPADVV